MAPVINYLTTDDIAAKRAQLLADVDMTIDQLRERADAYLLDAEERSILRALEDLEYLESNSR